MAELTPYPITGFKSGIVTYVQPWIRPSDAFSPLLNMYPYRDVLTKRNGSSIFGNQLADHQPVMGIMQRIEESTGLISLLVASTRNLYRYDPGTNTFIPITSISGSVFWKGNATGTINISTFWPNLTPGTVQITDGTTTITDNGVGGFSGLPSGIFDVGTTINYTTGALHVVFVGATANTTLSITATTTNYFTGTIANFFNYTNWQPTDPTLFVQSASYTIMTNGVDPITYYDGTNLTRPILYIDDTNTNYITKAQDLDVYKNALLLFRVSLFTESNTLQQSVFWSSPFTATNFNQAPGNGGGISVATGDIFISHELLRDAVIMFFTNSTWIFQYTGINSSPFRVDRLSIGKRSNCPYASIAYDERVTSLGSTGFIACDGVNVQRYDVNIIDYYETEMSEQYYNQVFSQRYDNLNQTWILYVSNDTNNAVVGGVAPGSDSALIYNHLENTWATFTFTTPMTCMGLFFNQTGTRWQDLTQAWEVTPSSWKSYGNQKLAPILLMGDITGNVYLMDDARNIQDVTTPIPVQAVGTRWNPAVPAGQKLNFTYVDLYYSIATTSADMSPVITVSFYVDDSENTAFMTDITLDGPVSSDYTWKRIYCNLTGQFIRMEITGGLENFFQFPGLIIWARPAGRFTAPGPLV